MRFKLKMLFSFKKIILKAVFLIAVFVAFGCMVFYWPDKGKVFEEFEVRAAQTKDSYPSLPMPSSGDKYQILTKYSVGMPIPSNLNNDNYLDWINASYEKEDQIILEARDYYGNFLWERNTGMQWAHDGNARHIFVIVWNIKQDTLWDEIMYNVWNDNFTAQNMVMLDGKTGDIILEKPFPRRGGGDGRQYSCIMYWNGRPYLVVGQSITQNGRVSAFDENLNEVWRYDSPYYATGHHGLNCYDLDGDGNEEILYGGTTLDSDGRELWSLNQMFNYGHVDSVNPGDLAPGNDTKEIFYAVEEGDAALMLDQNGKVLWHWEDPCNHQGSITGRAYDFDANYSGAECIINYDDCDDFACGECEQDKVLSVKGEVLGSPPYKRARCPEWTGDEIYDCSCLYFSGSSREFAADLGGGDNHGAEEVVKCYYPSDSPTPKKIEVYFNKSANSYPSRWQNRHYRQDVMRISSGYTVTNDTFQVQEISGNEPSEDLQGDFNNDGKIDVRDLGILMSNWGKTDKGKYDLNQDGAVNIKDFEGMSQKWN